MRDRHGEQGGPDQLNGGWCHVAFLVGFTAPEGCRGTDAPRWSNDRPLYSTWIVPLTPTRRENEGKLAAAR